MDKVLGVIFVLFLISQCDSSGGGSVENTGQNVSSYQEQFQNSEQRMSNLKRQIEANLRTLDQSKSYDANEFAAEIDAANRNGKSAASELMSLANQVRNSSNITSNVSGSASSAESYYQYATQKLLQFD